MTDETCKLMKKQDDVVINTNNSNEFGTQSTAFRIFYNLITFIQAISIPIFLAGQTMGIYFYEWTVKHGLQESQQEIGRTLVQVNRAFCASDTILYIPLLISSTYGLLRAKRWSLICTAASAGIHSYWAMTVAFMFVFLADNDIEEYTYPRPVQVWCFVCFYLVYGIAVMMFLYQYWSILVVSSGGE